MDVAGYNLSSSLVNNIKYLYDALDNYGETKEGIIKIAMGYMGIENGKYKEFSDAFNDFLDDRYGSWNNFKKTFAKDPVGLMNDFSLVANGAGFIAKGTGIVTKSAPITKAGNLLHKASKATDLLTIPTSISSAILKASKISDYLNPIFGPQKLAREIGKDIGHAIKTAISVGGVQRAAEEDRINKQKKD